MRFWKLTRILFGEKLYFGFIKLIVIGRLKLWWNWSIYCILHDLLGRSGFRSNWVKCVYLDSKSRKTNPYILSTLASRRFLMNVMRLNYYYKNYAIKIISLMCVFKLTGWNTLMSASKPVNLKSMYRFSLPMFLSTVSCIANNIVHTHTYIRLYLCFNRGYIYHYSGGFLLVHSTGG